MARMKGLEPQQASWFTRLAYWYTRRTMGKITGKSRLVEPAKIVAHHTRLLRAVGQMEQGQAAANSVPAPLKALAGVRTSSLIGCPF